MLWDAETQDRRQEFLEHTDWIRSVKFHPNGTSLASGSDDKTIKMFDLRTN